MWKGKKPTSPCVISPASWTRWVLVTCDAISQVSLVLVLLSLFIRQARMQALWGKDRILLKHLYSIYHYSALWLCCLAVLVLRLAERLCSLSPEICCCIQCGTEWCWLRITTRCNLPGHCSLCYSLSLCCLQFLGHGFRSGGSFVKRKMLLMPFFLLVVKDSLWIVRIAGAINQNSNLHFWIVCRFSIWQDLQAEVVFLVRKLV